VPGALDGAGLRPARLERGRAPRLGFDTGVYVEALRERLEGERPASLSATRAICNHVLDAQADAKRRQELEEANVYEAVVN
jgi:hypothetical protein